MKMIAYVRVSTANQVERGYGLDAQRTTIASYAGVRGWDLTWIVDEGQSGRDINRPGITGALAALKAGQFDGIVVAKLDRLSRSMMDFADILQRADKQHWSVVAIDLGIDLTTPAGEMVAGVMAAVARWERRMIGVRTREAFAAKRARGERVGGLVRTPVRVANRIHRERAAGRPWQAITDGLNADHVQPVQGGKQWLYEVVKRIGTSPVRRPDLPMLARAVPVDAPRTALLSNRERQVAHLIAGGLTDVAVAQKLGLSIFTIKDKTVLIRRTLQVHTRQAMIDAILAANAPA